MAWKPEVRVHGEWGQNALVFATKAEAEVSARDLMNRWLLVTDWRVVEVEEPVNYALVRHHDTWVLTAVSTPL